jgi:hypothetical protein
MAARAGERNHDRVENVEVTAYDCRPLGFGHSIIGIPENVMRKFLFAALLAAVASLRVPAMAQDDTDQKLGRVHFATPATNRTGGSIAPCAISVRSGTRGQRSLRKAIKADPQCGVAYWG